MMPFDSKIEFHNDNAIESQLNLHNPSQKIAMTFNNIVPIKTPLEIKTENGGIGAERENSNDSQSSCLNCQNLQQKLKISRGWNRFYREKVINVDKVLHIITEFEREKQKNLELQLAYDQRSREWSQQQDQLINLLTEVQPLREKLKIAEVTLDRETKERQKHQYMEESLKVTIQQLQAKVSHMNTIANPIFVENLEKKLNTSRSEIKKVKCNLEFKKAEVAELRSYITDKNIQVENLSKKLYWAFELANKYIKNEPEDEENTLERDVLKQQTEGILQSLNALYNTFYTKKKKEYKEKQIPLACLPSFSQWSTDFERKACEEDNQDDDFVIKNENSKYEKEASELEKLISDVTIEEAFANISKHDTDFSVSHLSSESPAKGNTVKNSEFVKDTIKKENKKVPPATKKRRRRISTKIQKHYLSPSPKKAHNSKPTEDVKGSNTESITKLENNCALFKNLMDKSFQTPKKSIGKSYETPIKPISSTGNKSSRKKSIRKQDPQTPDLAKHVLSGDLHLSDSSFISDSSESDMDDVILSKVKESLALKKNKSNKKLTVPFDDRVPANRKRRRSYNNNSTGNINTANDSDNESTKRVKDLELIRKMISEMTGIPPLSHFAAYSEETDSSSDFGSPAKSVKSKEPAKYTTPPNSPISNVHNESLDSEDKNKIIGPQIDRKVIKPLKKLPIKKLSSQKRKLCRVQDDDKSFVPQRVTRSSYKRQKQGIDVSADIKHQQEDKTIKESLPQKIENNILLSVNESSKESHFITPSPIWPRTRSRNNSKNSLKLSDEASPKEHPSKNTPSPHDTYNFISLDLNLSISSSNTDTEESDIDKIVDKISESSIKYSQDVNRPMDEFDSSTPSKSTSRSSFKQMEGKDEVNDSYEMTNPVLSESENYEDKLSSQKILEKDLPKNENYEDKLSTQKILDQDLPKNENYEDKLSSQKIVDPLLPDKIIEENSEKALCCMTVSCDDVEVEEDKIKEINNYNDQNCSLIMDEILNEKVTILISPISSPVKRPDLKSDQRNTLGESSEKKVNYDVLEHQTLLRENSIVATMESTLNKNTLQEKVSTPKVEDYNSINTILATDVFDEIGETPVFQPYERVSSIVDKDHYSRSTIKESSVSVPHEKVSSKTDEELNSNSTTLTEKLAQEIEETITFEPNKKVEDYNSNSTALETKIADGIEEAFISEPEEKFSSEVDNSNSAILSAQVLDGIEEASVSDPQGKTSSDVEDHISNNDKLTAKVAYEIEEAPISEANTKISSKVDEDHNSDSTTTAAKVTNGIEEAPISEPQEKVSSSVDEDHNSSSSILAVKVADGIKESLFSESKLCKDKSDEKVLNISMNKNLFSDDLNESSTSLLDTVSLKRTISESSTESLALSDSSVDNNRLNIISENENGHNKSASKNPLNHGWEENDESSLVMDIDDTEFIENNSDTVESSDEENFSVAEIKKENVEIKPLELRVDPENNFDKNTSVQEPEPSSFSFYKERRNVLEETDFQIPNIIFGESSTAEDEKKPTLKPPKKKKYSSVYLPLIKSHPDFREATFKLEESYMNSENLQEYFQDILGCYAGGPDWNCLIENIITYINNIDSPNVMGKFQPIIRNILVSVLRSSPYEKRDPKFSIPPTIYKLFHIVRILEKQFKLPDFALDSLVNISAHHLILNRKLRPNSLASLTTWVMSSCHAQYNKLGKPADEESLRWGRGFLTDLLFHHKGFVHESLLSAVSSSKRILIRIVKYRESTTLEKLIHWIAHHGDWEGPKVTRANLIQDFTTKLGLMKPPNVNPTDVIKDILLLLINTEADEDELSSCKAAFLLYLRWIPLEAIIKSLFPVLKNVYYEEEIILNKPSLDEVKSSIESYVKLVKWDEESEMKFLQHLKCFPIIKT